MYINIDHTRLQLPYRSLFCALYLYTSTILFAWLTVRLVGNAAHAAAATPPSSAPVTLTDRDNGKSLQLSFGQPIAVSLSSNPTTGYQWSIVGSPAPLAFVQSDYATEAAGRAGAGGIPTLRFTTKSAGKGKLKLGYARPWEKDVPPAKTFSVTVVVK